MDRLLGFLKFIVPPKDSAHVGTWRWAVFVLILVLGINAAAGRGLFGYFAYASASDVVVLLELNYAEVIRDLHAQICDLQPGRNATLENALEDYQRRYAEITGRRYPLPAC